MLPRIVFLLSFGMQPQTLPTVTVTQDDTVIRQSCRILIPPGTVIEDANGDGVIQIAASDIVVEFAEGSLLRGSKPGTPPDQYRGYGVRVVGQKNVTLRRARLSGFWCGLWATNAAGLVLESCDGSDNRRQRLGSTPAAEDGGDWLWPHNNDENEWLKNYGAAFYVEDSEGVTVRGCRVRRGQNGLVLDCCNEAKVYDNDLSFNSGWGVALWRSSRNVISRNAIDFCVRGYSHGVYNRGQDSAGILMFEQCCQNVIAENSVTHGGDGFFGFAGREALGETGAHPAEWYKRRGNNDNLLMKNDFSYAPAHGIEMTFSFGNCFIHNRLVGNAICGVWGGYSQDTLVAGNDMAENGEMGYGLERGGVNIEHGRNNRIVQNTLGKNKCGVHLWGGPTGQFAERAWAKANGTDSTQNLIAGNTIEGNDLAFHFRGPGEVTLGYNQVRDGGREIEADKEHTVRRDESITGADFRSPDYPVFGQARPLGARKHLAGRENILMTEWGPWDHESPLVRLVETAGSSHAYELHGMPGEVTARVTGDDVAGRWDGAVSNGRGRYVVAARAGGVHPYVFEVFANGFSQRLTGTLLTAAWDATFFKWTQDVDPREKLEGWRVLARGDSAHSIGLDQLALKYGHRGPSELKLSDALAQARLGGDHFGMIARTKLPLTRGRWEFVTLSDDGVRVTVDGKPVIENWTWHGPTRDTGVLELSEDRTVEILVEHFEIDGYAVLELNVRRAD